MELGTLTEHFPAVKAFPVMIIFIIYDPACLELSATQKYSVKLRGTMSFLNGSLK